MKEFVKPVDIRWADLDPNFHLRHSVYYDYGAYCRIRFFEENGLPPAAMQELQFGPILFREEAVFRREIRMGDQITINMLLTKSRRDYSRWSIRHEIVKSGDVLACILSVDGAWINTSLRKLATPPKALADLFADMPRSADFEWHGA